VREAFAMNERIALIFPSGILVRLPRISSPKLMVKTSNDEVIGPRRMDIIPWSVWAKNGACTYAMLWQALQDP